MSISAITVANFFVRKGIEEQDSGMTPMKVLKLTYIAYGWYWALYNSQLFNEPIQAWQYGPVIPSVYRAFKEYGNGRITEQFFSGETISDPQLLKFLNKIWEVYKVYSGWQLSSITHQPNTPWSLTWTGIPNTVIPDEIIQNHYLELSSGK